ncbi:MAG: nicotinate-nucleotide adenylyltransferase [Gammaproteobacteria bacterium]
MVGIYGGTFNPVHYGHLRTALEVTELFELDQLRMIPCRLPPHRSQPDVDAEMRFTMLQLAIADTPAMFADRRELDREGPSYMVDTLASLQTENLGEGIILFIGADAFSGLEGWHRWQHLFDYAHIVVMTRPGCKMPVMPEFLRERLCQDRRQLQRQRAGYLCFQAVTALDISATVIRELITTGRNPRFLLPDAVIAFIRQHQLYTSSI